MSVWCSLDGMCGVCLHVTMLTMYGVTWLLLVCSSLCPFERCTELRGRASPLVAKTRTVVYTSERLPVLRS